MGIDNAIICCKDFINCGDVIGMHYDTFGFIKIDEEEAKRKFSTQGKKLTLLQIGETISK
jgi:L-ascorbate metabolism protein UlaG (beta-lactamase superfamily)